MEEKFEKTSRSYCNPVHKNDMCKHETAKNGRFRPGISYNRNLSFRHIILEILIGWRVLPMSVMDATWQAVVNPGCLTGQVHGAEFGRDFLRHESLSGFF